MKKKFWDKTVAEVRWSVELWGHRPDPQAVLSQSQGVRGLWGPTTGLVLSPRQRPSGAARVQLLGGQASLDCLAARVEHGVGTFLSLRSSPRGLASPHTSSRTGTGQNRPGQIPVPQTGPAGPTRGAPSTRWCWWGETGPSGSGAEAAGAAGGRCGRGWTRWWLWPRGPQAQLLLDTQTNQRKNDGQCGRGSKTHLERQLSLRGKASSHWCLFFLPCLYTTISRALMHPALNQNWSVKCDLMKTLQRSGGFPSEADISSD